MKKIHDELQKIRYFLPRKYSAQQIVVMCRKKLSKLNFNGKCRKKVEPET